MRRADRQKIMHLANRRGEPFAGDRVCQPPSCDRVSLRQPADRNRPLGHAGKARDRDVPRAAVDDVLVNFVGDRQRVMPLAQRGDRFELGAREHLAARVVRRVDHDRLGARAERRLELGAIDRKIRIAQRHVARRRPGKDHVGPVVLVKRLEDDHLVARIDHRQHRRDHRLGRAACNRDIEVGIARDAVVAAHLVGDRAAEIRRPVRDRVLVVFLVDCALGRFLDFRRRREIGKPLRQVHRAALERPPRHLSNYGLGEQSGLGGNVGRHRPARLAREVAV